MIVAEMAERMPAVEEDDWADFLEADATIHHLIVKDKMEPSVASTMVWGGPKDPEDDTEEDDGEAE